MKLTLFTARCTGNKANWVSAQSILSALKRKDKTQSALIDAVKAQLEVKPL